MAAAEISGRLEMGNNDSRPSNRPAVDLPPPPKWFARINAGAPRHPSEASFRWRIDTRLRASPCNQRAPATAIRAAEPISSLRGDFSRLFSIVWQAPAQWRAIQFIALAFRTASTRLRTLKLFHDDGHVMLDGFFAYLQLSGNFLICPAAGDTSQDLRLASCEIEGPVFVLADQFRTKLRRYIGPTWPMLLRMRTNSLPRTRLKMHPRIPASNADLTSLAVAASVTATIGTSGQHGARRFAISIVSPRLVVSITTMSASRDFANSTASAIVVPSNRITDCAWRKAHCTPTR